MRLTPEKVNFVGMIIIINFNFKIPITTVNADFVVAFYEKLGYNIYSRKDGAFYAEY